MVEKLLFVEGCYGMVADVPTRDELAERYLEQLPYTPYPVQEEALLAWFTASRAYSSARRQALANAHRSGRALRGAAHR